MAAPPSSAPNAASTLSNEAVTPASQTIPSLTGSTTAVAATSAAPAPSTPLSSTPPSVSPISTSVSSANLSNAVPSTPLSAPPSPSVGNKASSSKNEDSFRLLFDVVEDKLLDDYSCALQLKSLLLHGRLYISDKNICFYANILGRKTTKIIPYSKILAVYKRNTAIVFSNAVEIVTRKTKYFFSSFMFRDGAYKTLTQAWSDTTPETVGRVILKAEGAELFLKPVLAGDAPSGASSSTEDDSSDDTDIIPAALAAFPVKMSSSSPAIPVRSRKSSEAAFSLDQLVELTGADATSIPTADGASTPTGDGSPSQTKKARRSSQPADTLNVGSSIPVKKRKKSTGSRSKGSITARRTTDDTVAAAAQLLQQKVLEQQQQLQQQQQQPLSATPNATTEDDWISDDKLLQNPVATEPRKSSGSNRVRSGSSGRANGSDIVAKPTPSPVASPPAEVVPEPQPVRSPTLMNQYDESQIESFLALKPPIREVPCVHIVDSKSDTGTVSTLAEKELKNLTVQQFYLLFWHNPQWWDDWSRTLEWTEFTFTDWQLTSPDGCCLVRQNNFRMPLRSIGPKSTRVEAEVHIKFKNKYHMLVETTAVSKDVPFGEAFTSHEKWSVIQSGPNLKIHVTLSVRWKKAAWGFRSTIEKKTHEGTKAQIDLWFQSAQPIIEQYQRGMREFEDQKERAKISTNAAISSASLQNTTSALTASVSALQQLSTSDSDSENEEAQQDKKDHEVMRHIRRNSSLAGDLASLSSLQPSPRAAVPNPAILNTHSRRSSETTRPMFASDGAISSLSSSMLGNESGSLTNRGGRRFDLSTFLASLSPSTIAIAVVLLLATCGMAYFMLGGSAVVEHVPAPVDRHHHASASTSYIIFLETLVASLLRNVTNPGSFVRQEEIYFKASKELENKLQQLAVFSADMASQLRANRLAQEELSEFMAKHPGSSPETAESVLLQHYNSHDAVRKSFEAAAHSHKPALSQAIRSSPWHIYLLYVIGSLGVASALAFAVLRFSGVSAPRIPFLSDLL